MKVFRGLFPPLITPFHADGSLNEQGLRDHVDFVIANGADGICAGSSTGEFMNLTREEWERVLGICQEQNRGRVPMLAGTADMSTPATIEKSPVRRETGLRRAADHLALVSGPHDAGDLGPLPGRARRHVHAHHDLQQPAGDRP